MSWVMFGHVLGWPISPKLPLRVWESGPRSKEWFLGPTRVHISNGISIGSAVFARLTIVTDRPTDRPRNSVCNNRPHLRSSSTMMRPRNISIAIRNTYILVAVLKSTSRLISGRGMAAPSGPGMALNRRYRASGSELH